MKWDHSFKDKNVRTGRAYTVREAYFQDHESAQTLRDVGGMRLTLRDHREVLLAIAKRNKAEWICTRFDFQTVEGKQVRKPVYAFHYSKEAAIDFLLGRDVLPGMES